MVNKTHEELAQDGKMEDYAIGSLLIESSCQEQSPGLRADHFYSETNRAIFLTIQRLRETGAPVDPGSVAEEMANRGLLSDVGGINHLMQLMDDVPNHLNFDYYAKKVIERRERAKLKGKFRQLMDALDSGEDLETVLAEADDLSTEQIGGKRFEFHSARELTEGDFKQEWHIPGWLAKAQTCIIAGPKKCLKTNILLLIAFCLCTANMLFRKFPVSEACNVGIMSGETAPGTMQETFNRIVKSFGWMPQYVEGFHICFKLPSLTNPVDLSEIKRFILDNKLSVFIFDPVYLCLSLGDGASNLFSVGEKLKLLTELGQETGCTIILVHHTRKSNGQNQHSEPELEEIAFAGFQEWARQWILLNRREAYKPDEPGVHKLWITAGGSAGHSQSWALDVNEGSIEDQGGRIWETRLFPSKEARAEKKTEKKQREEDQKKAQFESDVQKVVSAIESFDGPCVVSDIKNKASISHDRTKAALFHLVDLEAAEETEVMRGNKQKYPAYQLTRNHSERLGIPSDSDCHDTHSEYSPPLGGSVPSECVSESERDSECEIIPSEYENIFPAE